MIVIIKFKAMSKDLRSFDRCFLLRGISYPRQPRLPMRTFRRLRLRCLLLTSTPLVLPLSLSHHVEPNSSPTKHTRKRSMPFDNINVSNTLWWRCRALPPGPQCLCYEGITTILYYCNSFIKSKQRQQAQVLRL